MHKLIATLFSLSLVAGCSHQATEPVTPPAPPPTPPVVIETPAEPEKPSYSAEGDATYYASRLHGRRTASGETMDNRAFTAAHPSLPFGTQVRVTNLNNQRTVEVRINDRGPFTRGRIIDVSQAAAKQIDMLRAGVVPVRIEVLAP